MRWVEIAIEATETSADAASSILIEEGCGGAVIGPTPASAPEPSYRVTGYLPVDDRLEGRLSNIRERVRALPEYGLPLKSDEISISWIQDEDWATAWKKHFKPVRVGKIIVKPTWEEFEAQPGDIIVEIDPGMAFGTGYHPTTQLCLNILQDIVKGGETVLDMGTGSAVLAIAAAKLSAGHVTGLDIDSVAVEAAQANVEQAGLSSTVTIQRADSPKAFNCKADIVIANIIAKVLVEMAEDLFSSLRPGGKLVSSGIISERVDEVRDKYESIGLVTVEVRCMGDWAAIISTRPE